MKIKVKLSASDEINSVRFSVSDLGFTKEDWDKLSHEEKKVRIDQEVDGLPEQPYWVVDSFDETP